VADTEAAAHKRRLTARGVITRDRIVQAAADLFYIKGVNAVTLDDVRAASGTSKSQLYHHFADKDDLVRAVIALRADQTLQRDRRHLDRMTSFRALERWSETVIQLNALQDGAYGCAVGALVSARAAQDAASRVMLADTFAQWEELIAAGLRRMQANGSLRADADPGNLAVGLMAALQGGYLLTQATQNVESMRIAVKMALDHIRSYTAL
jgi:TetR/AcrR family transcriptional regulator, transcriptional repressor for nem operon